ncbi:extracellular solute-binding protein [Paenibacillus sp. N3.4]|uniref:extracellular solute-binding protein n=1 Tax=Paenibacillus sp. N3.4 TaxID=2603222 RepID=UPI00164F431A|nr:extracellular solute-binding protein [Paenibacillus sp. N3.4]
MTSWNMKTMLAISAITGVFTLTACGEAAPSNGNEVAGNKEAADKPVTLTMQYNWSSPNVDNKLYKERIQKFKELNPNIKIEEQDVPSGQYITKLRTQAAGKSLLICLFCSQGLKWTLLLRRMC